MLITDEYCSIAAFWQQSVGRRKVMNHDMDNAWNKASYRAYSSSSKYHIARYCSSWVARWARTSPRYEIAVFCLQYAQ